MKIAIAGFGIEGRVNYSYFKQKYPDAEIVIADERTEIENLPSDAMTILGPEAFSQLAEFDMVVRTASLPPRSIVTSGRIWSATNEFFAKCPAKIIGVTGTKGKGTTCSLITAILRAGGRKVHLVGNIGLPALEILRDIQSDDIVVYELSSFQLWDLKISPHVAVVLMVEPDHLDVHSDFEEYVDAKAQIAVNQSKDDFVIYNPTNTYSRQIASKSKGQARRFAIPDDGGVYVKENNFCVQEAAICSVDALQLVGQHNVENACAAISAVYSADPNISSEAILDGLSAFDGLPHRLKFVAEKSGVKYYDDSIATTPGSTISAIKSFESPKVLILGGVGKGADYREMIRFITDRHNSVRSVLLIGSNSESLAKMFFENQADLVIEILGKIPMSEIVQTAAKCSKLGDVVLLSPAAASFDMFKNSQDRGNQFVEEVKSLD